MVKLLPLLIVAGFLAGCAGSAKPPAEPATPEESGCYQAEWQAQSVPLVDKRAGPEALEKYETPQPSKGRGCP
ncbi:hypothetical protein NTD86_06625 [Pseudomonas sp. 7P_10.2_Bac1]|uniref:hypothetical protein n=1 Tax=Pseudomonas sp. 7P_10.2_Bac1 TaxID=2971614 RepID=UPI0021C98DA8|nr:hypothetical protein [Pseudomonas sp. 7P_10.2_Bac1]MCU1726657.1 hypothetical protein [Pseudomonas sp. 7P_10.2_Bac1]